MNNNVYFLYYFRFPVRRKALRNASPHFCAAKVQLFFDICKKKSVFFVDLSITAYSRLILKPLFVLHHFVSQN